MDAETVYRVLPLVLSPEGTLAAHTTTVLLSCLCDQTSSLLNLLAWAE